MTPILHLPYSPHLSLSNLFFVSLIKKKVLKGKCFADVEEVKQKNNSSTQDIKIDEFKTVLSSAKNI